MPDKEVLDLSNVREVIAELERCLATLDGERVNVEGGTRAESREKAVVNRRLLYAAHLADLAGTAIMCHYHHFKGETPTFGVRVDT